MSNQKDALINFYKVDKVKKYMSNVKDTQVKYTGIPIQKHIMICGLTGAGKSQALLNYIYRAGKGSKLGQYSHVMLIYKTYEPLYRYIEDELKDNLTMYVGLDRLPPVDKFPDESEVNKKQILIIFDDCVNDRKRHEVEKIQSYYTYGRKKGFTIIFLTQSYFQTDIFYRKQTSFILLCSVSNKKDLGMILDDCGGLDCDMDQLKNMFKYSIQPEEDDDCPFFKIDKQPKCPISKKFSKNFLQYLNPDDFTSSRSIQKKDSGKKSPAVAATSHDEDDESEGACNCGKCKPCKLKRWSNTLNSL